MTAFVNDVTTHHPPAKERVFVGMRANRTVSARAMGGQDAVIDTSGGKTPYRKTTLERNRVSSLVRPAKLTDAPTTGSVGVFDSDETAHEITRADVAQFCVDQLTSNEHVGRVMTIANSRGCP